MTSPVEQSAARLIRFARQRQNWTQAELARRVGMPASQLCAYESCAKQPSAATLDRILRAAGLELAARTREMQRPAGGVESQLQLADEWHRQRKQELEDVLALADVLPFRPSRRAGPPTWAELIAR